MLETLVTLWHKGLKFEHKQLCTLTPWRKNNAEISHVPFESKSMHVVNMVTYIIYINAKQQAIENAHNCTHMLGHADTLIHKHIKFQVSQTLGN